MTWSFGTYTEQGQLLRITDEVMPEPDIAAAANAAPRLVMTPRRCTSTTSRASPLRGSR